MPRVTHLPCLHGLGRISLAVCAALAATSNSTDASATVSMFTGTAATAGADAETGDRRGAAVALSGDVLLVGAPSDNLSRGDRAGSVLVYRRAADGWALEAKLVPPQPSLWGGFGSVIALYGTTAIVGTGSAFRASSAAFVYAHDGAGWRLQATLAPMAPPDVGIAGFGAAVAVSGARVLVGAPGTTFGSATPVGSAFVFVREGTGWAQQAMLRLPPDAPPGTASFGGAVALSGDDAIVGTRPRIGMVRGEAYAFRDPGGGGWTAGQRLLPNQAVTASAGFGSSVAIAGALAIVTAPGMPANFVFRRVAGAWQPQSWINAGGTVAAFAPPVAYFGGLSGVLAFAIDASGSTSTPLGLVAPPPESWGFGESVAADGQRVAIGAPDATVGTNFQQPGAVSIHVASDRTFALEQNLLQPVGPGDALGRAVAINGDIALLGAPNAGRVPSQGNVRWIERRDGQWREAGELRPPDGGRLRLFGSSIALLGARALIGGTGLNPTGTGFNRDAWLYQRDGSDWRFEAKLSTPAEIGQDEYGAAVALTQGFAFVGAPRAATSGAEADGAVHVFRNTAGGWVRQQRLVAPDGAEFARFGTSIAVDDELLLVGAPAVAAAEPGAVHIFRPSDSGWVLVGTLAGEEAGSRFGSSLFLDGDNLWIGAPGVAGGQVYRFPRSAAGFGVPQRFDAAPTALRFGETIAGNGGQVLVGSSTEGSGPDSPTIPGAVYRLVRVDGNWTEGGKIAAADYSPLAQFFGFALAADTGTFIVGAPRSGSETPFGNPFEGAAFIVDENVVFADSFEP
jgi:hypothetical protein